MAKKNNPQKYKTRQCVPAPMPIKCPHCQQTDNIMEGGAHYNTHTQTRYEYRICRACNFRFAAARPMTEDEIERIK